MDFFTYVIYNEKKDKIYIGQTKNLEERLKRHNGILKNKRNSFTSKNSGVWNLVYKEEFNTRREAMGREKELKSAIGRKFIKSITKDSSSDAPIA